METACLHCDRKDPPSTGKGEGTGVTRVGEGHATTGTHLLPGHHQRCLGREGSGSAGRQPPPQRASSPALSPAVVHWLLSGEKAEGQSASSHRRQRGRVPHCTEGRGAECLIAQKAEGQRSIAHAYSHWHASMSSPLSEGVGLSRPCSCRLADTSLSAMLLTSFMTSSSCTCDSPGRAESTTGRLDGETCSGLSSALPPLGWLRWAMLCVASGHMDESITTL